jgi:nucleoside 2-deoxyribosyltransferase
LQSRPESYDANGQTAKAVFRNDVAALRRCDVLLAILNGRTIDEGTAFELGVAWSLGKACWGFKDDFRQLTQTGDNPMIEGALRGVLTSLDEVVEWAAHHPLGSGLTD